jgi:hypothetical protein
LDLEEFIVLSGAVAPAAELLAGTGKVRLGSGTADLETVRQVLAGVAGKSGKTRSAEPTDLSARDLAYLLKGFDRVEAVRAAQGEAEQKAARRLGVTALELAEAAWSLWGQSLTAQRDTLVEASAPPGISVSSRRALRGRVTRGLLDELAPALNKPRRRSARMVGAGLEPTRSHKKG